MDMRTIDTVTVPKSFYWHGIWQAARWAVKVVDEEKGDVLLMAYLSEAVHDGQENVIAALRLGMDDVARLRALAGFGERPAPEGSRVPRYDVAHECNGVRLAELESQVKALAYTVSNLQRLAQQTHGPEAGL